MADETHRRAEHPFYTPRLKTPPNVWLSSAGAAQLVRDIQALDMDDTVREEAIYGCRVRNLVLEDDYKAVETQLAWTGALE